MVWGPTLYPPSPHPLLHAGRAIVRSSSTTQRQVSQKPMREWYTPSDGEPGTFGLSFIHQFIGQQQGGGEAASAAEPARPL